MHKHDFDFSGLRPVCRENFRSFLFVSFLYHDLGTLVRCVNNTRTTLASASRGSFTRDATCNSHSEYIFPPSIYFSLSSFPLSFVTFSFASSHFLAASPTHEFFLLACFHSFLLDAELRSPLILLPCIALLCIISIAAERPEVHIPYRMLS